MSDLTISHDAAGGTVLEGDPRPHHQILKSDGWRWSRNLGAWYVPRSRDTRPNMARIDGVREQLEAAGFTVVVEVDESRRTVAEVEADRAARAEVRAGRLEGRAEQLSLVADGHLERSLALADMVPLGQPILVGHHSEGRHRRHIEKVQREMSKGVEAHQAGQEAERRARAAIGNQRQRESGPTTARRIEKLEAEQRKDERDYLTPCKMSGARHGSMIEGRESCPVCWREVEVVDGVLAAHGAATGATADRVRERMARRAEELEHWRAHLADIGYVQLGKADMPAPGSVILVRGRPVELVKANAKTVSVRSPHMHHPLKYGYEDVRLPA